MAPTINNINQFFNNNDVYQGINWEFILTIPEFKKLIDTPQNVIWHREGNVFIHTQRTCNEMQLHDKDFDNEYTFKYMMLAALFHDIGKGETTKYNEIDGLYHCKNHGVSGEKITRKILWDIDFETREKICNLVREHMKPLYLSDKENKPKYVIELSCSCNISELLILKECDCKGAINDDDTWEDKFNEFKKMAIELHCLTTPFEFTSYCCKFAYFQKGLDLEYPPVIMFPFEKYPFKVIIMCGLPGSGKDTYIKENFPDLPTVCRDEIRAEIGLKGEKPMGNKKQESKVTEITNMRIKDYCRNKQSFIINATSIRKIHRKNLIDMVKVYGPFIEIIYVEAPTIQDNLKRRKGQIPESVILEMQANMDFPRDTECHFLRFEKQD